MNDKAKININRLAIASYQLQIEIEEYERKAYARSPDTCDHCGIHIMLCGIMLD